MKKNPLTAIEEKFAKLENQVEKYNDNAKDHYRKYLDMKYKYERLQGTAANVEELEHLRIQNGKLMVELNSANRKIEHQQEQLDEIGEILKWKLDKKQKDGQ
jgi:archaellum component FlaC